MDVKNKRPDEAVIGSGPDRRGSLAFVAGEIAKLEKFSQLAEMTIAGGITCAAVPPLRPALTAALWQKLAGTMIYVTDTPQQAELVADVLAAYLGGDSVSVLADWETFPYEKMRPNLEAIGERLKLMHLLEAGPRLVVAAATTLLQKVPSPALGLHRPIRIETGKALDLDAVTSRLVELGYQRTALVEGRGEFARRGSLIDIYPSTGNDPVRIDLFGDSVDSIRTFSSDDQRSTGELNSIEIYACQEFLYEDELPEKIRSALEGREDISDLNNADLTRRFLPLTSHLTDFFSYLPAETLWVVDEVKAVKDEVLKFLERQPRSLIETLGENPLVYTDYYLTVEQFDEKLRCSLGYEALISAKPHLVIEASLPAEAAGQIDILKKYVCDLRDEGMATVISVTDEGERERLGELLNNEGLGWTKEARPDPALPVIKVSPLDQGFVIPEIRLAVLGQGDIFPRHLAPQQLSYVSRKKAILDFSGLKIGDYLVHESHGIATYQGLTRRTVGGVDREYLILEYASADRLYLPTDQLHKISRYIGPDAGPPKITRLGSADWLKATKRAISSVKKLAIDLLSLYAERLKSPGYRFSPDTAWQRELENSFPHDETGDQLSAIDAVKRDMESPIPMDRLVCGDVGYGKTEVAIRAAFKTILDSKQVLMLVPTTILAQQHFLSFKERFAPFPIGVEMLSRFRSAAEQKKVVEKLNRGEVDLVVGTHRLLQKDISFKDLGLVIIDEEQRFGVGHKERLRSLKKSVDVLTLTATPIPRTLQMSLSGVRDLSIIDTPPEGRHPVLTYVGDFQPRLVAAAIRRELDRGGQIFYLHNRVENIDKIARRLRGLVPEARIIVGHGQMSERELENVMLDFLDHNADILVCTTIIESGLDIPNANTLIVEQADSLGLAQLYQLRGRVGRAHHQAYAYFTYPAGRTLTGTALERLRSIAKFTELGSGFKIALRDLEIRGAGNLLGAEQHGQMSAVGFELYCQMLRQAVDELQGRPETELSDVQLDLPIKALIPHDYIEDESLRLDAYRSLAQARNGEEIEAHERELADRFGRPPHPVDELFKLARLRLAAAASGISAISLRRQRLVIKGLDSRRAEKIAKAAGGTGSVYKPDFVELAIKFPRPPENLVLFLSKLINDIMPEM